MESDTTELALSCSYDLQDTNKGSNSYSTIPPKEGWSYSSSLGKTRFCGCCLLPLKVSKYLEIITVTAGVVFTLLLFTIPIIVHVVKETNGADNSTVIDINVANSTCSSESPWSRELTDCTSIEYSGTTCSSYLSIWQSCATNSVFSTSIYINRTSDIAQKELNVIEIINALNSIGTESCKKVAIPFICQYAFFLCHDGNIYLPSQETCIDISTNVCRDEWSLAISLHVPLPNCNELPLADNSTNNSSSNFSVICAEMFYEFNNTCFPRCDNFEDDSHTTIISKLSIELFAASIGMFMGIVVLVISLVRRKVMFIFPSVFLVYMTIGYCIVALFVLISQIDRSKLFCRYKGLYESFLNPSTFCTMTGVVFHYFLFNMTLWWFFHVCSLFYKVMFPLTAKRFQKYEKFAHILLLIIGVLLPLPGVLLALLIKDMEYTMTGFPPVLCITKSADLWYYSAMLPINLFIAVGSACFVILFWMVHKHQGIFHHNKSAKFRITAAETKLLCVLCYYIVFGVIALVYYGILTADQDNFIDGLRQYFQCESHGIPSNGVSTCDPDAYKRYNHSIFSSIAFLLMGFVPTANFVFVVNWNAVRAKLCFSQYYKIKDPPLEPTTDYYNST